MVHLQLDVGRLPAAVATGELVALEHTPPEFATHFLPLSLDMPSFPATPGDAELVEHDLKPWIHCAGMGAVGTWEICAKRSV